jgi:hypothetical protein
LPDETEAQGSPTGDLEEVPRPVLGRILGTALVVGVVVVGGATLVLFAGRLPEGTNTLSLVVRGIVGLTIGLALTFFVRRMLGALSDPPPRPATVDATEADVVYECPVCGTRVRLEVAATAKAPRHCGEEMEPKLVAR